MTVGELLRWQWGDYAAKHRNRVNLVIHLVAIPLFMVGCLLVVFGAIKSLACVGSGVVAMIAAIVLEGIGHKLEVECPEPFKGFPDFARRFFFEQWVTFPRYVLGGGWFKAFRGLGVVAGLVLVGGIVHAEPPVVTGKSSFEFVDAKGDVSRPVTVWMFVPDGCLPDCPVPHVFHGVQRNGETRGSTLDAAFAWDLVIVPGALTTTRRW